MKAIIIFLLIFVHPGYGLDCECGLEQMSQRIMNGYSVRRGKYPWMASIVIPGSDKLAFCTGSLINDRYILTAASCFNDPSSVDVSKLIVTLNVNYKSQQDAIGSDNSKRVTIDTLKVHPDYVAMKKNNLALLRLNASVQFDSTFSPICLSSVDLNGDLFTTGFGSTNISSQVVSDHLEETKVDKIKYSICNSVYKEHVEKKETLPESNICTKGDTGILNGDFGGPLFARIDGNVYQTGISSHHFSYESSNGRKKLFDVFEKVQPTLIWIESQTRDARWCQGRFQAINDKVVRQSCDSSSTSLKIQTETSSVVEAPAPIPTPQPVSIPQHQVLPRPTFQPYQPVQVMFMRQRPLPVYSKFRPVPVPVPVPYNRYLQLIHRHPLHAQWPAPKPQPALASIVTSIMNNNCECGVENLSSRIINGRPVSVDRYPWIASIFMSKDEAKKGMCGGSLINDKFILTAAHCLKSVTDVSTMSVNLGSLKNLQLESIHVHPEYNPVGEINDIALIKLKHKLTLTNNIRPICLPTFTDHDNLFATGMGLSNGFDPNTGVINLQEGNSLQEVDVSEVDMATCKTHYSSVDVEKDICAGGQYGGTCLGDSGGPLTTRREGHVYQIGITSFGAVDCGVISNSPNVFERTTSHIEWIRSMTSQSRWCNARFQAILKT